MFHAPLKRKKARKKFVFTLYFYFFASPRWFHLANVTVQQVQLRLKSATARMNTNSGAQAEITEQVWGSKVHTVRSVASTPRRGEGVRSDSPWGKFSSLSRCFGDERRSSSSVTKFGVSLSLSSAWRIQTSPGCDINRQGEGAGCRVRGGGGGEGGRSTLIFYCSKKKCCVTRKSQTLLHTASKYIKHKTESTHYADWSILESHILHCWWIDMFITDVAAGKDGNHLNHFCSP